MCPYLSANYVSDCPPNMAQVSVWPDNLQIVIACKLLRVIYTMLKTGKPYDPEKLLKDIRYPENEQTAAA